MDKKNTKNFIVYSRKVAMALIERGFLPEKEMTNPLHKGWICWVFENTNEFWREFQNLTGREDETNG